MSSLYAILILATLTLLFIGILGIRRGRRDDSDDEGFGRGGRGPDLPHPPEGGPWIDEPHWWPQFERQFREYAEKVASQPSRPWRRSPETPH